MKCKGAWVIGSLTLLLGLVVAQPAVAGGIDDFRLTRAIPADAMVAYHTRDHAGQEFVQKQFERVWAAVEKQGFDRDFKRLMRGAMQDAGEDVEQFDAQWQKITDLAAGIPWSQLCAREFAFALKIGMPAGAEFVFLAMPAEDQVSKGFDGLSAILKELTTLAPPDTFVLNTEGEGETVTHKLSIPNSMPPMSLTLARHKDVLVMGVGATLVEQSLALLSGQTEAGAGALLASERFQKAFKRLPAPKDSLYFIDAGKVMSQMREFAKMAAQMMPPGTQPAEGETPVSPLAFLPKVVDELDLWDQIAGVASTDGMQTTSEQIKVLREDAKSRPMFKVVYGNGPVKDPLKFVPQDATAVSVGSGLDFAALYKLALDFITREVPQGKDLVAQWNAQQEEFQFNVEEKLLSWLVGNYVSFTSARSSAYVSEWVFILGVRDEAKANAALADLLTRLNDMLVPQSGGVEDAAIEGADGFKRIMLPAMLAMLPGLGKPVLGIKDGHLFVANSPEAVKAALATGAGQGENFSKSERFQKEGLPLGKDVTAFAFKDLTKLGDELAQSFAMVGIMQMMMPPEAAKDPAVVTLLSVINKIGRVAKTLDFYRSSCSMTTFDGKASLTKEVTNYQEPPKPKAPEATTEEAPAEAEPAAKPAGKPAAEPAPAPAGEPKK